MGKITVELIRKRAEHNEGEIQSLEEISLHQEKLEKIELLDRVCRNLKILMLQNNSISKIENVGRLKHLEYLNLALNSVEVIENLEGCESLKKLDLTLNFIGLISSLQTLKPNYYLESLYLVGNPCHDFPCYRPYIITVLPQLKHLDGVEITKSERLEARQNFEEIEATVLLHQEAYLRDKSKSGGVLHAEADGDKTTLPEKPKIKKKRKPKICVDTVEADDEEEDDADFWNQIADNSPATRLEMNRKIEQQEAEKNMVRKSAIAKPKPPRKLETEDGRPLNTNEPKVSFVLQDEVDRNQLILDLALPKFLCTTLIDADVQPTFVRVSIKGKIFQLVLPEEVRPDSSYAQRSQTSGHLLITMPKVNENSTLIWRGGSGHVIDLTKPRTKNFKKTLQETSSYPEQTAISGKPPKPRKAVSVANICKPESSAVTLASRTANSAGNTNRVTSKNSPKGSKNSCPNSGRVSPKGKNELRKHSFSSARWEVPPLI